MVLSLGLLYDRDENELRRRTQTGAARILWRRLVERWEAVAQHWELTGTPLNQGSLGWHSVTPMASEAGLIYRLTAREEALNYVKQCIRELARVYAEAEPLDSSQRQPRYVLSHGEVALGADLCREELDAETLDIWLRLVREQIVPFTDFQNGITGYAAGGNISFTKNLNAALGALTWGDAAGIADWQSVVDRTVEATRQYLRHGFDRDGFGYEGSGYAHCALLFIFPFAELLKRRGWCDLYALEPVLERTADMAIQMLLPDFSYAATTNDSGIRSPYSMWWLLLTAREYKRPEHRGAWAAFQGPEHPLRPWGDIWPFWSRLVKQEQLLEHIDSTLMHTFLEWTPDAAVVGPDAWDLPRSACASGTGTAAFRSSWRTDAVFSCLLGGGRSRICHGHSHADCGHFGIAVGGEYLAIDTGRYNTNEDQHNVVLVDGANCFPSSREGGGMAFDQRSGRLKHYQTGPLLDHCTADATHMKDCVWALRDFFFVRIDERTSYILLLDNINKDNSGPHRYLWQLHAHPETEIEVTGKNTACVRGKNARLDCAFFQKPVEQDPALAPLQIRQDEAEWIWPYGREQDIRTFEQSGIQISSVRRPRLLVEQQGFSCLLLSAILPRRTGEAAFELTPFPVVNGMGLDIRGAGVHDRFYVAPDHAFIDSADARGFAEFALLRYDTAGRVIQSWTPAGSELVIQDQD